MPGLVETKDLAQLRRLNQELLRQLWARREAVRRSVAKAASEPNADASSSYDSEMSLSQKTPSVAQRTSSPRDASEGDSCYVSSLGGANSGVTSLPPAKEPRRPCVAPMLAASDSNDSERSAEPEAQAPRSIQDPQRELPKLGVTFHKESPVPERSWRLRPYLGYDWIAGSLDNRSPISSKPEAFFWELQAFREANKEECIHGEPEPQLPGRRRRESDSGREDHECVYCYRVNRRLFLVPSDPGIPCRLCRTPRDQRGPKTLADPAQVRVSIPQSVLDPPHRYRVHRRKSFDASDTLALPRHCLLGWDILPPESEKSRGPQSLDLWSCVASEAQHRPLPTGLSHPARPARVPSPAPIWSEPQAPRPRPRTPEDTLRPGHLEDIAPAIASSLLAQAGAPGRGEPCPASARGARRPRPPRWGRWVGPDLSPSWAQKG